MAAAAPVLRAEDFVLDPTKEQIVTFAPLPGEPRPDYLARRAASGFRPPRIHTFGGVRQGAIGYISTTGRRIGDVTIPGGIRVEHAIGDVLEIRLTRDRKIYLLDNNLESPRRRVAFEPNQGLIITIMNADGYLGSIQTLEGVSQLYPGIPGGGSGGSVTASGGSGSGGGGAAEGFDPFNGDPVNPNMSRGRTATTAPAAAIPASTAALPSVRTKNRKTYVNRRSKSCRNRNRSRRLRTH